MIDLGWEMSSEEAQALDELTLMVPSETVREYMEQTGHVLSDRVRAILINNSEAPLKVRYWLLEKLAGTTADSELRRQIEAFLNWQREGIEAFQQNDGHRFVYSVSLGQGWTEEVPLHLFPDYDSALQWALAHRNDGLFELERNLITEDDPEKTPQPYDRSTLTFDREGRLKYFTRVRADANEDPPEDHPERFLDAFYDAPNPFDRGDIVWSPDFGECGVVETSAASLRALPEKWSDCIDYGDVQLCVAFFGTEDESSDNIGHIGRGHISPIYLERYEPEGWESRNGLDGMLLAAQQLYRGEGSLGTLHHYARKFRDYRIQAERDE